MKINFLCTLNNLHFIHITCLSIFLLFLFLCVSLTKLSWCCLSCLNGAWKINSSHEKFSFRSPDAKINNYAWIFFFFSVNTFINDDLFFLFSFFFLRRKIFSSFPFSYHSILSNFCSFLAICGDKKKSEGRMRKRVSSAVNTNDDWVNHSFGKYFSGFSFHSRKNCRIFLLSLAVWQRV